MFNFRVKGPQGEFKQEVNGSFADRQSAVSHVERVCPGCEVIGDAPVADEAAASTPAVGNAPAAASDPAAEKK